MEKAITFINTLLLNGSPVNVNVINIIAKGIVMASDCILLAEHGCFLSFSKQYGRKALIEVARTEGKMMRRIATTSKVPISPWLLREKKYTFKRKTNKLVTWWNTLVGRVLNFDQTQLSYNTVGNEILEFEGPSWDPVEVKGKSKQITRTFTVSVKGKTVNAIKFCWKN